MMTTLQPKNLDVSERRGLRLRHPPHPVPGLRDELTNPSRNLTENETTDHLMRNQFRDPMTVTQ